MTPQTSARRPASIERLPAVAKSLRSPSSKVQPATLSSRLDSQSVPDASGDRRAISMRNFPRCKRNVPRKAPDTSSSAGVAMRERGQMPPSGASNLLYGQTFRTLMRLIRRERRNLSFHRLRRRRTRPKLWNRARSSSTRRAQLTSAYRPDAASTTGGGLQIGSMEIRIVSPPATPPAKTANPVKGRAPRLPASAPTRLSRGFDTFGLIQG